VRKKIGVGFRGGFLRRTTRSKVYYTFAAFF